MSCLHHSIVNPNVTSTLHAAMASHCTSRSTRSMTCLLPIDVKDHISTQSNIPIALSRNDRGSAILASTIAERRCCLQPPILLLTLSKKRPIRNVVSQHSLDEQYTYTNQDSSVPLAKRMKEPSTPIAPTRLSSSDSEDALNLLTQRRSTQLREHEGNASEQQAADAEPLEVQRSKVLLSPISLNAQIEEDHVASTITKTIVAASQSKYQYYPPTNPFNGHRPYAQLYCAGPSRQLSYGEPTIHPKPRSLHKATGSAELRQDATCSSQHNGSSSWFDDEDSAPLPRPWHSEPQPPKARLWLDLTGGEGHIEEAVSVPSPSSSYEYVIPC